MTPRGWKKQPVGKLCRSIVPGRNKPKNFTGDIPWVTTPEIFGRYIPSKRQRHYTSIEDLNNCGGKLIPPGSVVMSCVGELGLVAIAHREVALNQQLHAFICSEEIHNEYLAYCLEQQKPYMESIASKTTIPYMNKTNCESIPVLYPKLEEQTKIAEILSTWDKAIEITKKLIENSKAHKKGLMQQLLTEKRATSKSHAKRTTIQISELTSIYDGTHSTPHYVKEGVPFYSVEHLTRDDFSETKFVSNAVYEKESLRVKVEKGDILMTRIGDIGTSKYLDWDVQASFYVSLALIKQGASFNSLFLSYYIQSEAFQRELWKRTIHVAFPKKINLGDLGKCIVSLPPIEEQKKIAKMLTSVDQTIKTQEQKLECLIKEKQSLMQQLLTGKRRVKVSNTKAAKAVA
jgi:type I restriction enzyme, S subunit